MTFNFDVIHEFLNSMLLYIDEMSRGDWFAIGAITIWGLTRQFGKKPPLPPPEPPQEP